MKLRNYVVFLVAFLVTSQASARNLEQLIDDWHVLTTEQEGNKVCYIAAVPTSKEGNYKKRSEPYLLVSKFTNREPEVSISAGYRYKPGAPVKITISNNKFDLQKIKGEVAWAVNTELDNSLIAAMKAGNNLTAKGTSTVGSYSIDTYSLKGFTKAYGLMIDLCKAENIIKPKTETTEAAQ